MRDRKILVTGGAGFIGCHLVERFVKKYPANKIINLDSLTYAGDISRLKAIESSPNYIFIKGDIKDIELTDKIFQEYNINGVIHLAAESHVDNSINNPRIFIETNVLGTQNLLECARKYWFENNGKLKTEYDKAIFLHISTDEVYGTLGDTGFFTEETAYAPNSPYSASKAASDLIVRSYFRTYGLPIIISNCSNNYGPKQHEEKLIPTIIRKALLGESIPIYGNGKHIRDWLYVTDHCFALDKIFHYGKVGENYNIGTHNEKTNINLAYLICELLDKIKPANNKYSELIAFVKDRAGHDYRYAIDNSKITKTLGWQPTYSFEESLQDTIKWYIKHYKK